MQEPLHGKARLLEWTTATNVPRSLTPAPTDLRHDFSLTEIPQSAHLVPRLRTTASTITTTTTTTATTATAWWGAGTITIAAKLDCFVQCIVFPCIEFVCTGNVRANRVE